MTTIRHSGPARSEAMTIESTGTRMTPSPASARFRAALESTASVVLSGVEAAAPVIPGGNVVAASIRGQQAGLGSGDGESPEHPGGTPEGGNQPGGMDGMLQTQADDNMRFLQLQARIQQENQRFTTLSNVMKARHETAKTAIGNIR